PVIDKLMRARIIVGVAATVLLGSGVAVAATGSALHPTVSRDEISTTSTSVGNDSTTSTSVDDSTTSTTAPADSTTSTTAAPGGATTTTEPGEDAHDGDHPENHG